MSQPTQNTNPGQQPAPPQPPITVPVGQPVSQTDFFRYMPNGGATVYAWPTDTTGEPR